MNDQKKLVNALIISLSPNTWRGPRMNRHQIMSGLAHSNCVLFMDPPRTIRLRDIDLQIRSTIRWRTENFGIYTFPWWKGKVYRPSFLKNTLESVRLRDIQKTIGRFHEKFAPVILYIWHPKFWEYAKVFEPSIVCYHIYDDFDSYLGTREPSKTDSAKYMEDSLLQHADVCFAVTPELCSKKSKYKDVIWIPNGVEYELFRQAALPNLPVHQQLSSLKRPVIGYIGTIGAKVDFPLLIDICQQRPHWSLVMIGKVNKDTPSDPAYQRLQAQPNAFFMGEQPYETLPNWLKGIDVCLMSYRLDSHARYGYPLKMLEYFAAGKPTVSADIPAVRQYAHALKIAHTLTEWINHIESYLAYDNQIDVHIRQQIAAENTWETRVDEVSKHLITALHEKNLR